MRYRPIFVVGTGRSGTSFTAGVLHERLGICMGDAFNPGSVDGKPTWEDQQLYWHDHRFAHGDITLPYYLRCIRALFADRFQKKRKWGYKSPMSGYCLHFYMQQLWPVRPVLILAKRPLENVIESCLNRYKDWTPEIAEKEIYGRAKLLDILCAGHKTYVIDYANKRTAEDVEEELRGILDGEDLVASADPVPDPSEIPQAVRPETFELA